MQAVTLKDKKVVYTEEHPVPQPRTGEALVRVSLAGICSTDLELVKGYYPFNGVLGHEFVGVVAQCDDPAWIGRRVVGTINISADCPGNCGRRCPEHCPHRTVLGIKDRDGAFAPFLTLPTANLLAVPDTLRDEQAVFTEPLAAALRITEQITVRNRQIAVLGPGRLGLLVAQVLRHAGGEVLVIGRSESSLQLPRDLGFPVALNDGLLPTDLDVAVDVTGNVDGFRLAVELVRPQGTVVLKSTCAGGTESADMAAVLATIVVNELTVLGSRCGPFDQALAWLEAGTVRVEPLIERTFPLSDAIAALEYAARPGVRKVLLRPDPPAA
jgi:threonine dehydrogenase-like Zn-dependent dehydrogenase